MNVTASCKLTMSILEATTSYNSWQWWQKFPVKIRRTKARFYCQVGCHRYAWAKNSTLSEIRSTKSSAWDLIVHKATQSLKRWKCSRRIRRRWSTSTLNNRTLSALLLRLLPRSRKTSRWSDRRKYRHWMTFLRKNSLAVSVIEMPSVATNTPQLLSSKTNAKEDKTRKSTHQVFLWRLITRRMTWLPSAAPHQASRCRLHLLTLVPLWNKRIR